MNTSEVCRSLFRLYALVICVKIKIQKLSYPYASQLSSLRLFFDIYVKILFVCTVASNKFWSSRSFFDAIENAPL
jgi:hypothetical protein